MKTREKKEKVSAKYNGARKPKVIGTLRSGEQHGKRQGGITHYSTYQETMYVLPSSCICIKGYSKLLSLYQLFLSSSALYTTSTRRSQHVFPEIGKIYLISLCVYTEYSFIVLLSQLILLAAFVVVCVSAQNYAAPSYSAGADYKPSYANGRVKIQVHIRDVYSKNVLYN